TYTVSDARFEVASDGTLKLKAGQHLDYAAEKTVALTVTATDAGGLSTQKTFTLNVADDPNYPAPNPQPQNQPGSVSITGDAQVGGTLSAQIADADGFNPAQVQYQWQRDGQPIDGATSSQYTLKAEDAGHKISVQARYDDNAAHHETPTSPASDIPAADPHAGALAVTGAAKVGAILTTAITDVDGVPQVGIHYQWFADGKAIEGATHEVYRIRPEDIGKSISVQASYTDNSGHAETTNTAAVAQNVADNPATQGAHGHKLYAHEEFGKYIDARDFGVNPANADNTAALKAALKAADDEGAALYLGAGTLKLHEQLRIGTDIHHPDGSLKQEGYQNVRAIFGAGMGKTKLTFDWQQQGEYDPAHNATDARDLAGVLIDGINGKSIADLSVAYQHQTAADFYRPQASYFGKINGIVVNDADNTRIDTVEVTGANRAGVFFTSTATSLSGARQALIDHQISEADAPAGDNNQLLYSNLHHNRVAGAMIGYQRGFSADSNTAAYNGHEADGGTGYGIATLGGSYNFGVSYTRNITDHNYRKGLDSHEGNHIHIENNISNGDRLVGLGVSNHQFTMDNVTIRHNTIIADPNFRCTSDDGDKDAQIGQGENYHAYEGVNLLTNIESNKIDLRSQGPGTFNISDNTIRGLETYNDANTSAIAVHNYEPTMDYTLNIRDNHIDATSVKTAIAINNATRGLGGSAGEGSGDIRVSGNTIHITKTGGRPSSLIYIAETEHDGTLRGSVAIENNRVQIDARDDKGEIIRLTGNAKTYDISGNVLEQHGNSNTTLITINGQGSTEKTTLNVHDNTFAADWPRPGKYWIEAGTESVAGAHIQSHNNTYNGAAITEDAPPAQNHAPDDITLSASQVAEGKDGASVGKLTTTDPDAGDAHRYTVSDARFEVTADGTLKLKAGLHLDYAAEKTIALTVTATDAGGLATQKTFTLSVQDDPNYPAPNPQPNPNPQPPSAATLTVRETDDATPGSIVVGKLGAGEALTVDETTLNTAKLADLAREPRTVIDDAKGTLTLTGYDAASGTLTYRYDPKAHASHDNQQATVDFIIGREAFRGTNGVGVQPFNPRWAGDDSAAIEESYARAAALGVKWVRITAGWNQVQPQDDGSYDWRYVDDAVRLAQKYGMKVLMQVMGTPNWASDIGDLPAAQQQKLAQEGYWTSTHAPKAQHDAAFARFFGEAVKRYSAQGIHDYEFWNEPGNKFWRDSWANPNPNPEHYTRLLKLVYEAAHAADAEANVLAGGMTVGDSRADGSYISPQEFLERMYKAGAQGYFDALSHHPYGILAKDFKDNGWAQMNGDIVAPGAGEKTLMQIMQAHGDGGKLIWPSEVGWDAMFAGLAETYQANTIKTLLEWQQKANYTGPLLLYQAQNDRAAYVQGILNRDDNGDGIVDVNIDTNGDGIPDANIDADHN
ncbi:MAG: beta-galactosidase, partial [Cardiobacterium hominis]